MKGFGFKKKNQKKPTGEVLHFLAWHCSKGEAVNWQSSNIHGVLVPFWSWEIPWPEGVGRHLQEQAIILSEKLLTSLNHGFPPHPAFYLFASHPYIILYAYYKKNLSFSAEAVSLVAQLWPVIRKPLRAWKKFPILRTACKSLLRVRKTNDFYNICFPLQKYSRSLCLYLKCFGFKKAWRGSGKHSQLLKITANFLFAPTMEDCLKYQS